MDGGAELLDRIQAANEDMKPYSPPEKTFISFQLKEQRKKLLSEATTIGTDAYYTISGDTAVYTFDSFNQDVEAWKAYMADRKELPDDAIGNLFEALEMASSDPSIKNIVIDLTTNEGGYLGIAGFIYSLITGESLVSEQLNTITGEVSKGSAICDINLDGKFDDADHAKLYDLNFGVLTSACTFSSGNYLPVVLKDAGVAILGERSGGGVCNLVQAATADGIIITTSGNTKMVMGYGEPGYDELKVEGGAEPDIGLTSEGPDGATDYSKIYDLKLISEGMNSFYASA